MSQIEFLKTYNTTRTYATPESARNHTAKILREVLSDESRVQVMVCITDVPAPQKPRYYCVVRYITKDTFSAPCLAARGIYVMN